MPENAVGDYELIETVGESETFVLYRAQHVRMTGRFRAVKMPQTGSESFPLILKQESLKATFLTMCAAAVQVAQAYDAATAAEKHALRHIAFIETVHFDPDADIESHRPYILSEWVPGSSVEERLRQGPLPIAEVVRIVSGVLEGLAFLHSHGIVHGNLKPGNILLTLEGTPKLTDFGGNILPVGASLRLSALPYLSPEQMMRPKDNGSLVDARTDLFSLTLVLYEMLTGKRLGRLLTPERMPSCLNPLLPPAFDGLIVQGLQSDPNQRSPNALAMRERLLQIAAEEKVTVATTDMIASTVSEEADVEPKLDEVEKSLEGHTIIEVDEREPRSIVIPEAPGVLRSPGERRTNQRDGAEMVWVPGGILRMGSEEREEEKPIHEVAIKGFWLYRFPVTQALYNTYWMAVKMSRPIRSLSTWIRGDEHAGKPIVGLNWQEAYAYAQWAGGRLASEAEWEWAARGSKGSHFPWGDTWYQACANTQESGLGSVSDVTAHLSGASWCDAVDMLGNAFEWCSSLYRSYPYDPNDGREDLTAPGNRVLRGGAYSTLSKDVNSTLRTVLNSDTRTTCFRLVVDEETRDER